MVRQYVEFIYQGFGTLETKTEEVPDRSPDILEIPKGCIGYRFYEGGKSNKRSNISEITYVGEVLTLKQIESQYPEELPIQFDMKRQKCDSVLRTQDGNFILLSRKGETIDDFLNKRRTR